MKSVRQEFLENYLEFKKNNGEVFKSQFENQFKKIDNILNKHNLSEEEKETFVDVICSYESLILETISNCPFVEIKINNFNDKVCFLD